MSITGLEVDVAGGGEDVEEEVAEEAEGDKVQIQVRKSFLHRLEPAANWDKVLKLVDASSAFTDKEIVIMK